MKRLLSLILAIAMCISLFPVFAAAADNSVDFSFYTNGLKYSSVSRSGNRGSNDTPVVNSDTTHRIITFNYNASKAIAYTPGVDDSTTTTLMAATWEITVPASGTYVPQINYIACTYSPKWEIFLTKKPEDESKQLSTVKETYDSQIDALDSADFVGMYDGYSTDVGALLSKKFIDKTLSAGTYYLTIIANGEDDAREDNTNDGNRVPLLVESFTLTPATAPARDHKYDISLTATTSKESIDNNNLATVSWLKKGDANAPILDTTTGTDEYQLSCRLGGGIDNSPSLVNGTFVSQFLYKRWDKKEGNIDSSVTSETPAKENYEAGKIQYGIRIKIKQPGIYKLSLENEISAADLKSSYTASKSFLNSENELMSGAVTKVYFAKATDTASETLEDTAASRYNENAAYNNKEYPVVYLGLYDSRKMESVIEYGTITVPEAGEYYIIFKADAESLDVTKGGNPEICEVISSDKKYLYHYQLFLLSGIELSKVTTAEDEALAAEQAKYDTVKTAKEGAIASTTNEGLSDTSYINIIAKNIDGDGAVATAKQISATRGESVTVTADVISGYDFLYWRSGLGKDAKVITNNPECTVKAIPGTWLTAVYKAETSERVSVLFYNADGDIISNNLIEKGTEITFPDTPVAPAGCGAFTGWALNTKDNIVSDAVAEGNSMVFVAQFEDTTDALYAITVNNIPLDDKKYYGEEVTVNATERNNESNVFVYWKKGDEIVSFDKEYTFNVFENCELTAVYAAYKPVTDALRKIIIKGEGENIIAEFIGLDSAVEAGILFHETATDISLGNASHKIAMTTDGNHLAALNDVGNCIGYAILSNGSVIYDK